MGLKTLLFGSLIFWSCPALVASDIDELEAGLETFLESVNSRDLENFRKAWHPEAVLFFRNNLFPVDLKDLGQRSGPRFSGISLPVMSTWITQQWI